MPKRKSGGQTAQAPKQAAGGGASRSSNPQAANRANTSHRDYSNSSIVSRYTNVLSAQKTGNTPAKPPAASAPKPPQNAQRPNGTRCKPLASKPVNDLYSSLQPKFLPVVMVLPNLKAPTRMANNPTLLPEVSIRKLELAFMNFVGLHWSTLLVWTSPQVLMNTFDILLIIRISITSRSNVCTQGIPRSERGWG